MSNKFSDTTTQILDSIYHNRIILKSLSDSNIWHDTKIHNIIIFMDVIAYRY